MKSFNETIKNKNEITHSISLLKVIISSIEAYPEFNKTLSISKLDGEYLSSEIEPVTKKFNEDHEKISKSCIAKLKTNIYKLEELIKLNLDKRAVYNIEKRINYLDLKGIKKTYNQETNFKEKQIIDLKLTIKSLLEQLDKSLPLYAKLEKKDSNYVLIETLNNQITLKEIFEQISIENIVEDLILEDYEYYYYSQLGTDPLDYSYTELYTFDTKAEKLKKLKTIYPNIILAEKLAKLTKEKDSKLEKDTIEVSKLLLKIYQLQNLKDLLAKKEYNFTINHIDKLIRNIQEEILDLEKKIKKRISQEFSKIDIRKSIEESPKQIKELIQIVLDITANEAKKQFNYDLHDISYREIIKPELNQYQQLLLKENYNITQSIEELQELLSPTEEKKDISYNNRKKESSSYKKFLKKVLPRKKK